MPQLPLQVKGEHSKGFITETPENAETEEKTDQVSLSYPLKVNYSY